MEPVKTWTVALVGNPNTGKSTLFNALSGARQRVGNYPGVTVEKKTGRMEIAGSKFTLVDLPGTYSLAPRSPDEMVTVDVLLGRQADEAMPDAIVCIVDASNLERNLYLVSQVLELGLPTVIALNMTDVAKEKGITIDLPMLRKQLPLPIVPVQANRSKGMKELREALATAVKSQPPKIANPLPEKFQAEVAALGKQTEGEELPRFLVERLLLDTSGYLAGADLKGVTPALLEAIPAARERLKAAGIPVPGVEAANRYAWASSVLKGAVTRPQKRTTNFSDRVDRVLTHWFSGTLIFIFVMLAIFQGVTLIGGPAGEITDAISGLLKAGVEAFVPEGQLRSLLQRGVIVFVPQIALLFLFIGILEDCGYMARAAYLMDKLMVHVGLSGKSFIPLLSSFACAIPGIMAARVIENRRDRFVTILVAPLMSCSARLPVYQLMGAAFLPDKSYFFGLLHIRTIAIVGMYFLGIVVAAIIAWILKKTYFRGPTPPFVMELPTYKWPGFVTVLFRVGEQSWSFIKRAGTLILAVSIVVWALAYYPHRESAIDPNLRKLKEDFSAELASLPPAEVEAAKLKMEKAAEPEEDQLPPTSPKEAPSPREAKPADPPPTSRAEELLTQLREIDNRIAGAHLENSFLGQMGHAIEPAVRPLGWDWRLGCAAIASFPAREVIVATLGIIYNLGEDEDESSPVLQETLRDAKWKDGRPLFTIPVALSVMVFFSLCAQCAATLVVIKKETGHWSWPVFSFVYMTVLAYVGALVTFQVGTWMGL